MCSSVGAMLIQRTSHRHRTMDRVVCVWIVCHANADYLCDTLLMYVYSEEGRKLEVEVIINAEDFSAKHNDKTKEGAEDDTKGFSWK